MDHTKEAFNQDADSDCIIFHTIACDTQITSRSLALILQSTNVLIICLCLRR